jgi:hypothetical protein
LTGPTAKELGELKELTAKAAASKKAGADIQRQLFEKANKPRLFEYQGPGSPSLKLVKLPFPDFLRILAKVPEKLINLPPCPSCNGEGTITDPAVKVPRQCEKCGGEGEYIPDDYLTPDEIAQVWAVWCEALSAANPDGLTPEQIGRMTPPEYPEDFLAIAFRHLLRMNLASAKDVARIQFFRGKPGRVQPRAPML